MNIRYRSRTLLYFQLLTWIAVRLKNWNFEVFLDSNNEL